MEYPYQIGQNIHGFRITDIQNGEEPLGHAVRMKHERTGADLFWLDNNEENMVFSITFRTLPSDSTGVFHILEHSLLCGSRKYPVREPFVELLKSSMNTFLNAMTFPDMTMYPVASRNFRDLMNLTRVYLDGIFHPAAMDDHKVFCQEGWHIDRDENGKMEFKGVVYNEMKGSMSDPDTLMDHHIAEQLFPDTCYGFNSGGDPGQITSLSWEAFKKRYYECYHPSNAYIYLDGRINPDEMLETINESFEGFERREKRPEFRIQIPVASEKTIRYEISPEEEMRNHSHLTMARIVGTWQNRAENLARSVISDVLTGTNEAPLKREALERGLCKDLNLSVDDTGLQSWISIHADNVTDGKEAEIDRLITETGRQIIKDGLDREAVEASLNRLVFYMREDEEPRGISRCIRTMGTWLYGGNPEEALRTHQLIRELRTMMEDGRIDELAVNMLMNRENMAVLHTIPSRTAGEEKRREEKARLHAITEHWTEMERAENDRTIDELKAWQETPDPAEMLKKLPMLTRKDADIPPKWTETEESELAGVRIMTHRIPCNGVMHLRAYFPLTGFTLEELTKAGLFAGMLAKLPTKDHDAFSLQLEIKKQTGSLGFGIITRSNRNDDAFTTPYLLASMSVLEEKTENALRLLNEILTRTQTEGQEDRIRDMMIQNEIDARQRVVSAGHIIAVKKVLSQYSADGAVRNALDGEPAVAYIHRFSSFPDDEMSGFMNTARRVLDECISKNGMIISVTGLKDPDLSPLLKDLPDRKSQADHILYRSECSPVTGFRIPSMTGFTARGYTLKRCGIPFSGIVWLTSSILSLEYLWNRIRVRGGAYGAGLQVDRNGNIFSYSYRDPTPRKTLRADKEASAFIRSFAADEENIDKYIVSSLNELNPLLSPRETGALADSRRMNGITREETEQIRQEILNAKGKDLIQFAEWLDQFAEKGCVCVAGPAEMLEQVDGIEIHDL